jgi:hypothetical protein
MDPFDIPEPKSLTAMIPQGGTLSAFQAYLMMSAAELNAVYDETKQIARGGGDPIKKALMRQAAIDAGEDPSEPMWPSKEAEHDDDLRLALFHILASVFYSVEGVDMPDFTEVEDITHAAMRLAWQQFKVDLETRYPELA